MFYAGYALRLKKELSIDCALGEVPADAGKTVELDSIFCEVRYKDFDPIVLDPEYEGTTIIRDAGCHLSFDTV